jgi:hypothetical protein
MGKWSFARLMLQYNKSRMPGSDAKQAVVRLKGKRSSCGRLRALSLAQGTHAAGRA